VVENLVQREPENLDLRLQLAQLYENTGQIAKAETEYEQILLAKKQPQGTSRQNSAASCQGDTKSPVCRQRKLLPLNPGRGSSRGSSKNAAATCQITDCTKLPCLFLTTMSLLLGQLVYTSFPRVGFKTLVQRFHADKTSFHPTNSLPALEFL